MYSAWMQRDERMRRREARNDFFMMVSFVIGMAKLGNFCGNCKFIRDGMGWGVVVTDLNVLATFLYACCLSVFVILHC